MKISTAWGQQSGLNALLSQQSKVNQSQIQLAQGKKILKPSDNPVDISQIMNYEQRIEKIQQYQDNLDMSKQRLSLEETTLKSSLDVMNRIKELGLQGLNGINNQSDLDGIADEIEQMGAQLLGLANTQNANGEYLFSGMESKTVPFVAGSPYVYQGDSNQRTIQVSDTRQIADGDPGNKIFGPSASGAGDSVFDVIKQFANELRSGAPQPSTLGQLDTTFENIIATQSSVGARLNAVEQTQSAHEDYLLDMQTALSGLKDLDYAEAISRFNQQNLALQAAQQSFSKVQNLSLFNYL